MVSTKKQEMDVNLTAQTPDSDEAFTQLFHHHIGMVWSVYRDYLNNRCRPDDWQAEALETLLHCRQRYQAKKCQAKFSTYFMAALRNKAIDYIRKQNTKQEQFNQAMTRVGDGADWTLSQAQETLTPEHAYIARETLVEVLHCRKEEVLDVVRFLLGAGPRLVGPKEKNARVSRVQTKLKRAYLSQLYR